MAHYQKTTKGENNPPIEVFFIPKKTLRKAVSPIEVLLDSVLIYEFMYGEWLREQFEKGEIPEPTYDPDLVILLAQARKNSINLFGPKPTEILDPVPITDIGRVIKESLPMFVFT